MLHGSAQSQGEVYALLGGRGAYGKMEWLCGCRDTVVCMGGKGSDGDLWKTALRLLIKRALDGKVGEEEGVVGPPKIHHLSAVGRPVRSREQHCIFGETTGDVPH